MTPDKTGPHIPAQEKTAHNTPAHFSDTEMSGVDLPVKETLSDPSTSVDFHQKRRRMKRYSKYRDRNNSCRHHCHCCGSNDWDCDCTLHSYEYASDSSVSRGKYQPKMRHKKSRARYSSDSDTLPFSRNCRCNHKYSSFKGKRSQRDGSVNKLCSSCQISSHAPKRSSSEKLNPDQRIMSVKENNTVLLSNRVQDTNNEQDHHISKSPEETNNEPPHPTSLRSSPSISSTDKKCRSVSTPDLSDTEAVFIGSSSSESEKKRPSSACRSCCRSSPGVGDQITDAPFLKIALALEKYLDR